MISFLFGTRVIFFTLFIILNSLILTYITKLESKNSCLCIKDKSFRNPYGLMDNIEYLKTFTGIAILIGVINLFLPIAKLITSLPFIGGLITMAIFFLLLAQMVIFNGVVNKVNSEDCKKQCDIGKFYKKMGNLLTGLSTTTYVIVLLVIVIGVTKS